MMRTNDESRSPCDVAARHRGTWRRSACLVTIASMMFLALRPRALAAQEYYNLDAGRPTRLEDATPTDREELDIQMPALRLDQVENGPRVWRADSKLSYGIAAFSEVELRLPLIMVDPPSRCLRIAVDPLLEIFLAASIALDSGGHPEGALATAAIPRPITATRERGTAVPDQLY